MKPTPSVARPGLVRVLGPIMTTALVIGTVIGSGVFQKPNAIAKANVLPFSGPTALVWIVVGVFVVLGALSYAEVAVLYPKAGGNYVFLREGYGRLWGWLWGWVEFWIIRTASIAALATIFTRSLNDVLGYALAVSGSGPVLGFWAQRAVTVTVILGLALVNVRGVRWGGGLQVFVTTIKVGSLLVLLLLPFLVLAFVPAGSLAYPPRLDTLRPVWPDHWQEVTLAGVCSAFYAVLWAYHGWMNIGPIAEEVSRPQRNIPLALLTGVAVVIFLYLGVNLAYYLVIPQTDMAALKETTVAAEFARRLLGPIGLLLAASAVMISVFGALNGNLLVGPRLLYAMGADGLAPHALYRVHPRFRTPALAILVMAAWAALLVIGAAILTETVPAARDLDHFDLLTDLAMFGAVIFETMAVMTIFVFRWRRPDAERPYRCWGYPVVPALYVLLPAFVIVYTFLTKQVFALSATAFIVLGVVVYYAFGLSEKASGASQRPDE